LSESFEQAPPHLDFPECGERRRNRRRAAAAASFFSLPPSFFSFSVGRFPLDTFDDLLLLLCPSHSYSGKPKLTQSKLPSCSKQGVIEGLGEAQGEVVCRGEAEQGGEGGRGGGAAGEVLGIRSPKPGEVAVL